MNEHEQVNDEGEVFEDITLTCIGFGDDPCKKPFVWTANDQKFYKEKGFSKPKRCRVCAKAKREALGPRE
jgi:Probable zinc-ribbon domain